VCYFNEMTESPVWLHWCCSLYRSNLIRTGLVLNFRFSEGYSFGVWGMKWYGEEINQES
jgi:hypothetical protein